MQNISISIDINNLHKLIPKNRDIFVIIDNNLKEYMPLFKEYRTIGIETSEEYKDYSTIERIISILLAKGADRKSFIVGVGGGITTDMAGFAASIYKRGIEFGFVPTTLLAMCDAAIGGKNGVNFGGFKNMIGTITQPQWVFISPEFLKSLPNREFKAGAAEALKTFMIYDREEYSKAVELFGNIERGGKEYLALESTQEQLLHTIKACSGYKAAVVERDMYEHGERRLLNLGHTFAHAIESCCNNAGTFEIMHGEAVAIGLVCAAELSQRLGIAPNGFAERVAQDIASCGLPTTMEGLPVTKELIVKAITKDKKVENHGIHLILPKEIGHVEDRTVPLESIENLVNI